MGIKFRIYSTEINFNFGKIYILRDKMKNNILEITIKKMAYGLNMKILMERLNISINFNYVMYKE